MADNVISKAVIRPHSNTFFRTHLIITRIFVAAGGVKLRCLTLSSVSVGENHRPSLDAHSYGR